MHTEAINHDPALTFIQTGAQEGNRPSMGSWLSYGLGSENKNSRHFVYCYRKVKEMDKEFIQNSGPMVFLIPFTREYNSAIARKPVLYLNNPEGVDKLDRRKMLDNWQS